MGKKYKVLLGLISVFLILIVSVVLFVTKNEKVTVEVYQQNSNSDKDAVIAAGNCISEKDINISIIYPITVKEILVRSGMEVKKGQTIAKLDSLQAKNMLSELLIKQKTEVIKLTKMQSGGYSNKEIELQKEIVEFANSKVEEFKSSFSQINVKTGEVTSIVDGVIKNIGYSEGDVANIGKPLFQISSNDLEILAGIEEENVSKIKLGCKVSISGSAFDGKINGTITFVGSIARSDYSDTTKVSVIDVLIKPETNNLLKNGYNVDLEISQQNKPDGITIPIGALKQREDGESYVFILKDDIVYEKNVNVLNFNSENATIENNIDVGSEIIIKSSKSIKKGQAAIKK